MNFTLNEDQKMVRETVRRYAADSLGPRAERWDEEKRLPREVFAELRDLGLLGLTLPVEHGGSGLDDIAALLAVEELARQDASTAVALVAHTVLAGELAARVGRTELVENLASGQLVGTFEVRGAEDGGEALLLSADSAELNGAARELVQCHNADIALVRARGAGGGRSLVRVDRDHIDVESNDGPLGCRAADLGAWHVESDPIEDDAILARDDSFEWSIVDDVMRRAQAFLGAVAVGIARGALEEGLTYANDREQFGRPISRFQANQFKLADMSTRVDACRLVILRSADSDLSAGRIYRAAQLALDAALFVEDEGVQLHGGYGYTSEYPVERYLRDARTVAAMLGGRAARSAHSGAALGGDAPAFR